MSITNPFSLYSQIQFFTALFCTSSCAISNVNFAVDSSILPTYWSTVMLSLRVCVCVCVCIEFQTISSMFGVCWFIQYIVCCDRVTHSVIRFMQNAFDSILKNHFCDKLLSDVVGHDTFFFRVFISPLVHCCHFGTDCGYFEYEALVCSQKLIDGPVCADSLKQTSEKNNQTHKSA